MFTGLVEEVGVVQRVEPFDRGRRITVAATAVLPGLRVGDSIATDGICLTVVALHAEAFVVEAIATTIGKTTAADWAPGRRVNLERALALGDRLGGHLVQGHVDGVGRVERLDHQGEQLLVDIAIPDEVAQVTVLHGSIAVDGVSLTVAALPLPDTVRVALIPHTRERTNLGRLAVEERVNLEGDMIGRFVVGYLERRQATGERRKAKGVRRKA